MKLKEETRLLISRSRVVSEIKNGGSMNTKHRTAEDKRIYNSWDAMNKRCYCESKDNYDNYGGRGIKVCDEWNKYNKHGFDNFLSWAKDHGYSEGLTIDRINPDGDYCPENCKWATRAEQNAHLRLSHKSTSGYKGVTWNKVKNKWQVGVSVNYKSVHIGFFSDKEEAVKARNQYIIDNKLTNEIQEWVG